MFWPAHTLSRAPCGRPLASNAAAQAGKDERGRMGFAGPRAQRGARVANLFVPFQQLELRPPIVGKHEPTGRLKISALSHGGRGRRFRSRRVELVCAGGPVGGNKTATKTPLASLPVSSGARRPIWWRVNFTWDEECRDGENCFVQPLHWPTLQCAQLPRGSLGSADRLLGSGAELRLNIRIT